MAKNWKGMAAADAISLPPGDWPCSWQGPVTIEDVALLRDRFGGKSAEMAEISPSEDLDDLLRRPRASMLLVVEEWGST